MTAGLSSKDTLEKIFARSGLQVVLESIEENIEELLCILLLGSVCGCTIKFLEGEAEGKWIDVGSLRELQVGEESLHLMQHVVVNDFLLVFSGVLSDAIFHTEQVVAESWDHKELLHHRVHVADASEVLQTHIVAEITTRLSWSVLPTLLLLDVGHHGVHVVLQEVAHESGTLSDE